MNLETKIAHISGDSVFVDHIITQFEESSPGISDYFVFADKVTYIKQKQYIKLFSKEQYQDKTITRIFENYNFIIIHGLVPEHASFIVQNPSLNFLLMMWGADTLYMQNFYQKWYTIATKRILTPKTSVTDMIKRGFKRSEIYEWYYYLKNGQLSTQKAKEKALKIIQYIAPVIKEDFNLIKKEFNLSARYIPFSIGSLKTLGVEPYTLDAEKSNVLIGNSGDPSNNHKDVFNILQNVSFQGKIICPLSYGNDNYRDYVKSEGKRLFGKQFFALDKFLPIEEYQEIIDSCGIVIMNHLRQQAMGNIISALYQGKKVFLNDYNYTVKYFQKIGVKTYSIQSDLLPTLKQKKYSLSEDIIINNRKNLENEYAHNVVISKTKQLIELVTK